MYFKHKNISYMPLYQMLVSILSFCLYLWSLVEHLEDVVDVVRARQGLAQLVLLQGNLHRPLNGGEVRVVLNLVVG